MKTNHQRNFEGRKDKHSERTRLVKEEASGNRRAAEHRVLHNITSSLDFDEDSGTFPQTKEVSNIWNWD